MLEMRRTGVGYRFDVLPEDASFLEEARAYGVLALAVPLLVEDAVWGVVFVNSREPRAFPADTEDRVLRFTALAGIAIAHTRARANLAASRARLLAAADASRRKVQRDLHDGAQQRLMQTILGLKLARDAAAGHECAAAAGIEEALGHAERAKAELHDLVRGVLPAVLTRHGLRAALESLVNDLPLEVVLNDRRPAAARPRRDGGLLRGGRGAHQRGRARARRQRRRSFRARRRRERVGGAADPADRAGPTPAAGTGVARASPTGWRPAADPGGRQPARRRDEDPRLDPRPARLTRAQSYAIPTSAVSRSSRRVWGRRRGPASRFRRAAREPTPSLGNAW